MNISVSIQYVEPELRRLHVDVDDEPYVTVAFYAVQGLRRNVPIGQTVLSVAIDPQPPGTTA